MPTAEELEVLITNQIDKDAEIMIGLNGGGECHGRKTEPAEELGIVDECSRADRVSGKDILQD